MKPAGRRVVEERVGWGQEEAPAGKLPRRDRKFPQGFMTKVVPIVLEASYL